MVLLSYIFFPSVLALGPISRAPNFHFARPDGFYFRMSIEVTFPIWKWSKQKGARLLLLVAIGDYANAEGIAWPSVRSLAKRTRMTDRYVQKMLREIEADGEIEIVKRTNTSNVYRVRIKQPPAEMLAGELEFTPPVSRDSPPGEQEFAKVVNRETPNPSGEPSLNLLAGHAEAIYQAYPRKIAKGSALKAIGKVLGSVPAEKLLTATLAYAKATGQWPEDDKRFIPYPATWFNRGSYEDDPKNWQRTYDAPNRNNNPRSFSQRQSYAGITDV